MPFVWSPDAEEAFLRLKKLFITAPVLAFPDPDRQFIVEVDASDTGIGAVLSQRSKEDQQIHPVAFLSRRFSPAERNYDVGNRELLAVHAALEEWRHWLEGAQLPVLIWTDHKNLTYIREVKRLGPRQARWALLFSRFNYTLTNRPGSKNVRADALSRVHQGEHPPKNSNPSPHPPGLSESSPGASNRLCGWPSAPLPSLPGAPRIVSLSPSPSAAGSSFGATPVSWPVIPGFPGPASSFAAVSGGPAWMTTSGSLWRLARYVPGARRPTDPRRDCSGPYPSPVDLGLTSPWTT